MRSLNVVRRECAGPYCTRLLRWWQATTCSARCRDDLDQWQARREARLSPLAALTRCAGRGRAL